MPGIGHISYFYPRSPCGERLRAGGRSVSPQLFLSTLSLRRATTPSIFLHCTTYLFLSTLSLRRATLISARYTKRAEAFLSTLSLRRATVGAAQGAIAGHISIHALLAESDLSAQDIPKEQKHFYPRSPCGERLKNALRQIVNRCISIHALLAESDLVNGDAPSSCFGNFYPRSPCGERLGSVRGRCLC